ncbi:MAG: Holliday junction branch migration protein RuvA [Lachnospiraceae bacterium]|nr:Holliday junction branch migration protein RuvA [Lachnospiraceae bacterium]
MIGFLKGTVEAVYEDHISVDVNGIGFNVYMSARQLESITGAGADIKVYTHLAVREDSMTLYGFTTYNSLKLFGMLIQVNGIGPRGALALLSTMDENELSYAIMSGDSKAISSAPGIGQKTAQRIILDLKDKVSVFDMLSDHGTSPAPESTPEQGARAEAIEALTALGYSAADALKAVRASGADKDADTETIIKLAFKHIH